MLEIKQLSNGLIMLEYKLDEMKYMNLSSGTGHCIPSANHNTVHSDSAMDFMSGFPSNIPQERTHISFTPKSHHILINDIHATEK